MTSPDQIYADAVTTVIRLGDKKPSRVGDVVSLSGLTLRFDLRDGFPLLEHKQVPYRLVCVELAWIMSGRTCVDWLQKRRVHIWDDDAAKAQERGFDYDPGELGPVYGRQWRGLRSNYGGDDAVVPDQLTELRHRLDTDPLSRRHVVTAWNPQLVPFMVLPPCHHTWQVIVSEPYMDLVLSMRSGDMGLGVPFNIASYATLLTLLATEKGRIPRHLVITIGDAHVYADHVEPLMERLQTFVQDPKKPSVTVDLPSNVDAFIEAHETDVDYTVLVHHYQPMPKLKLALHT